MLLRPPLPGEFRFTAPQREALSKLLRLGGHVDMASDILALLELQVEMCRGVQEIEDTVQEISNFVRAVRKQLGRRYPLNGSGRRSRRGPKTTSNVFVGMTLRMLDVSGVRIAGGSKFKWLEDFLKALCDMAEIRRPNIRRAIEEAARMQNSGWPRSLEAGTLPLISP